MLALLVERGRRGVWTGELHDLTGVPRSTILTFMRRLDGLGWVESTMEPLVGVGAPRRVWRLTASGGEAALQFLKDAAAAAAIVARVCGTLA